MKKTTTISLLIIAVILSSFASYKSITQKNKNSIYQIESKEVSNLHNKTADLLDFDLSAYGIGVITKAPQGARVIVEKSSGDIIVYGGKNFKITFKKTDFKNPFNEDEEYADIAALIDDMKLMAITPGMDPNFEKLEVEEKNGYMTKSKSGKLYFVYGIKVGLDALKMTPGMTYDLSPDKFTDYTPDDIRVMFGAAKATRVK
jgi:hypothetical protein